MQASTVLLAEFSPGTIAQSKSISPLCGSPIVEPLRVRPVAPPKMNCNIVYDGNLCHTPHLLDCQSFNSEPSLAKGQGPH
mmetsp:Transcript_91218/g.229316  ORF Transcript_91218/g.229316 Transcript_91218/m.229316 type:complete len:80 (-) Transcript_91218:356-595(-)